MQDQARYRESDEQAPYVPPKPKPTRNNPRDMPGDPDVSMGEPDTRMDDQITGGPPPPPAPPAGYASMIQGPSTTALGIAAEGVQPSAPPPPMTQLYYQPLHSLHPHLMARDH